MENEIDKHDYEVCLIGCGAYGLPLAAHVKKQGKKAIHIGGALQLLFGIMGKRWIDFEPFMLDGKLIESWTSTTTPHQFEIKPGKYVLTETIAPAGYVLSTESIEFEVKDGKVVTTVTMLNSRDKVTVEISKQDATTGKELPGATLELRDSNGKLIESWVSTNETHKVKLDAGTYTLTETIAPEGYELSTETVTFTVGTDGKVTGSTVMLNKPIINVPLTADFVSPIVYIVGSLCVLFGLGMVTLYVKKPSFNK